MRTGRGAVVSPDGRYRLAEVDDSAKLRSMRLHQPTDVIVNEWLAARSLTLCLNAVSIPSEIETPDGYLTMTQSGSFTFVAESFIHDEYAQDFERTALSITSIDLATIALVRHHASDHLPSFWSIIACSPDTYRLTLCIDNTPLTGFTLRADQLHTIPLYVKSLNHHCSATHAHLEIPRVCFSIHCDILTEGLTTTPLTIPIFLSSPPQWDELLAYGAALADLTAPTNPHFSHRSIHAPSLTWIRRVRMAALFTTVVTLTACIAALGANKQASASLDRSQQELRVLSDSLAADNLIKKAGGISRSILSGTTIAGKIRWAPLLKSLSTDRPEGLYLSQIGMESGESQTILVEGIAPHQQEVTTFVAQLENSRRFTAIVPAMIGRDPNDSTLTRFTLRCTTH